MRRRSLRPHVGLWLRRATVGGAEDKYSRPGRLIRQAAFGPAGESEAAVLPLPPFDAGLDLCLSG